MSSRTYRESFEEHQQLKSQGASTTFGNVILNDNIDQVISEPCMRSPNIQINASLPCNFRDALSKQYDSSESRVGIIAKLPAKHCLKNSGSVVLSQAQVNDNAYCHPCLTLTTSKCGRLVFCAPMTSFGNNSITEKYSRAGQYARDNVFYEYVALNNRDAASHSTLPILRHEGLDMLKPTYVHLDSGFWIEWDCLAVQQGGRRHLTAPSLVIARELYALAENHRQRYGSSSKIPTNAQRGPCTTTYHQGQRSLSRSSTGSSSSTDSSCGPSPVLAPARPFGYQRIQRYHNSQYRGHAQHVAQPQAPAWTPPARQPARTPFNPMTASWRQIPQRA
ncbi:hypothetical protein DOTSEDRAFT_39566 [Dothistroma septosporum NZE10]|uniref:Uncharacterized protein n=1 Tax=Dothistroma septosporum (strain NZE10 / CBS 128990) TaxID=675120 RepID=N1PEN4_DOTSN|nr:hypothetical protein DOTSEDRAFT_39566 [Dothistroma septosporum NZE10]